MFLKNKGFFSEESERKESADIELYSASLPPHESKLAERLRALCEAAGRRDLTARISRAQQVLQGGRFSVAFVGEFSRGKSTLINAILGRPLLPTGSLPTTHVPVWVKGGERDELWLKLGAERKTFPLTEQGWQAMQHAAERAKGAAATLSCVCPRLSKSGALLLDTPGGNAPGAAGFSEAERALAVCDGVILAAAAVSPLGETELRFLEERILLRTAPRAIVVLTKLDLVREDEREQLVRAVQNRLASLGAEIPLFLSSPGLLPGWESVSGEEAILERISRWMLEEGHESRRRARFGAELAAVAGELEAAAENQLAVLSQKGEKGLAEAAKRKETLSRVTRVQWGELEIELLGRCSDRFAWIDAKTEERRQDAVERLTLELSHTSNPKEWWENDCPYRLKTELIALGNALENRLQSDYARDRNWLNAVLRERYQTFVPPEEVVLAESELFRAPVEHSAQGMEDLRQSRLISRIGTGVATIGGYLLSSLFGVFPIGVAIGLGGGILSEVLIGRRAESQRRQLGAVLCEQTPEIFARCADGVKENLRTLYLDTIHATQRACNAWAQGQIAAIDAAQVREIDPEGEQKLRQTQKELAQIRAAFAPAQKEEEET